MRYLALFMLLTACGPEYVFEYPNIEGFYVKTNANYDPEDIAKNIALAKGMFIENGIVKDERDFNDTFEGTILTVRTDRVWKDPNLGLVIGVTDPFLNIEIQDTMGPLFHEMLHRFEGKNGVLDTGSHPSWTSKGYYVLDESFTSKRIVPRRIAFPEN